MLSISTCWNSARHEDGAAMIEELLAFGFDRVELGHGIRASLLGGIQKVFDAGRVRFSSLHNFCPLPVEVLVPSPDCLLFTSYNDRERERAVRQTLQTIDTAARFGAPNVVLHGGRVVMAPVTARLKALIGEGKHLSPEYARLKWQAVRERERIGPKYVQRLADCLRRITDHAGERGVRLGLESRYEWEEIPTEREFDELLAEFPAPTLGYWHDIGHTQTRANLGFVDHAEWLRRVAPRLIGCHLHDVQWPARDHMAPFTGGTVDYKTLVPLIRGEHLKTEAPEAWADRNARPAVGPETLFVWEMSPRRTKEEIAQSLELWRERFGGLEGEDGR